MSLRHVTHHSIPRARLMPGRIPQISRTPAFSLRAIHQQSSPKTRGGIQAACAQANAQTLRQLILRHAPSRPNSSLQPSNYPAAAAAKSGSVLRKLLTGGAIFGGTIVALNMVFNRETRDDGGMPDYERDYLNQTFMHTGLGVGIIGFTAYQLLRSGFTYRMMVTNPWVVAIGGLALSFGTMLGARSVSPDNYIPKYALWTAFNATQAAMVAPLLTMMPAAIIARAGLYTAAMMGSISYVGATAKQEKYLYIGGPLLAGAGIVLMSGLAPLVVPVAATRTLAFTEGIWLYGGLAVFGGFTLYDVQKVLHHARMAEAGVIKRDPVNESISLELDFLNIFIRMAQILMMQQNNRRK